MSEPSEPGELVHNPTHEEDALDLITPQYEEDASVRAVVTAIAREVQLLEDAIFQVYGLTIANAQGKNLDLFGRILLEPRGNSADDEEYRLRLLARGRVLRSAGRRADVLDVFRILMGGTGNRRIKQHPPAKFELVLENYVMAPNNLGTFARLLRQCRAAGVGALLNYSLAPAANTFSFEHRVYTYMTAPSMAGAVDLTVASTSKFPPSGSSLFIDEGTTAAEAGYPFTITDATHIHIASFSLVNPHQTGAVVRVDDGTNTKGLGHGKLRGGVLT